MADDLNLQNTFTVDPLSVITVDSAEVKEIEVILDSLN